MRDGNENKIEEKLKSMDWDEFYSNFSPFIKDDMLLKDALIPLYHETQKNNIKFKDSRDSILKNLFMNEIPLGIWSKVISYLETFLNKKKYDFTLFENLPLYDFIFLIPGISSKVFNLIYNVIEKLDKKDVSYLIITRKNVLKKRKKELKRLENADFLLEYLELKRLSTKIYKKARKEAERKHDILLKEIENDAIKKLIRSKKNLFRYHYKGEYIKKCFYKKLFSNSKPKVIMGQKLPEGCIELSEKYDVNTIIIQHGLQSGGEGTGKPFNADKIIVWGDYWKENFEKNSSDKTEVLPLGCPRFDEISKLKSKSPDRHIIEEYNINKELPTILFLSQPAKPFPDQAYKNTIDDLEHVIKKLQNNVNFLIKLHPRENKKFYNKNFEDSTLDSMKIIEEDCLFELLKISDIAISINSTALIEATLFDVPFFKFMNDGIINHTGAPPIYFDDKWGILVKNGDKLFKNLEKMLEKEGYKSKVQKKQSQFKNKLLSNIGFSSEKIAEHLLEIS